MPNTNITKDQIINSNAEQLKKLVGIGENTDCKSYTGCEYCTSCTSCDYCTSCTSCTSCDYCTGCWYCTNCTSCDYCTSCTDCYNSQDQKDKQYVFCNVQLTRDEYFDALRKVSR